MTRRPFSGIPGSEVGIQRVDGVKKGLDKAGGGVEIVKEVTGQFDRNQAIGAMEDILQTDPDLDAVFAANDQMALGAIQAIAAHDKTEQIKLIGFDGALENARDDVEEVRGKLGGTGRGLDG